MCGAALAVEAVDGVKEQSFGLPPITSNSAPVVYSVIPTQVYLAARGKTSRILVALSSNIRNPVYYTLGSQAPAQVLLNLSLASHDPTC